MILQVDKKLSFRPRIIIGPWPGLPRATLQLLVFTASIGTCTTFAVDALLHVICVVLLVFPEPFYQDVCRWSCLAALPLRSLLPVVWRSLTLLSPTPAAAAAACLLRRCFLRLLPPAAAAAALSLLPR